MPYIAANNATSTLVGSLTTLATTFSIQGVDVAKFPTINQGGVGSDYTYCTFENAAGAREIVKITRHDNAAASFTMVRAQEGTVALAWAVGDTVSLRLTAGVVTESFAHPGQTTGAHAATAIAFTPTGGISSNHVQGALAELDGEKQAKVTAAGPLKGDGSGGVTAATAADITALLGATAVNNATNATTATEVLTSAGGWRIREVSGTLYFEYNGVKKLKLSTAGVLTALQDVTANNGTAIS